MLIVCAAPEVRLEAARVVWLTPGPNARSCMLVVFPSSSGPIIVESIGHDQPETFRVMRDTALSVVVVYSIKLSDNNHAVAASAASGRAAAIVGASTTTAAARYVSAGSCCRCSGKCAAPARSKRMAALAALRHCECWNGEDGRRRSSARVDVSA